MNAPLHTDASLSPSSPNATGLLAKSTYEKLREGGLSDTDIMAFAGELLSLVASDVSQRAPQS